jgi:preprotein translocase subunit SecB
MADLAPPTAEDNVSRQPGGEFHIRRIFAKDISFETPNSPTIFASEWKPETDINLRTQASQIDAQEYEVVLSVTATVQVGEHTAYLVEVQQAGIFSIVGLTSDELASVLGSYCPSVLYPYAREMISDLVIRGGFPPFVLAPVNFEALYAHQQAEQEAAATASAS